MDIKYKVCNKCDEKKPSTTKFFYKSKSNIGGLAHYCIDCGKLYALSNKEHKSKYNKRYAIANKERLRLYRKARYERDTVKDAIRAKKYYSLNKERISETHKLWGEANRAKSRLYASKRNARKEDLLATLTQTDVDGMTKYFNYACAVCRMPFDMFTRMELDHWIPLSHEDCPGTVVTNMIPLCGNWHGLDGYTSCNMSKHNRDAETWLTSRFGKRKANKILKRIREYFNQL